MVPAPTCDLPPLPDPIEPKVVGYPTPDQILMTKTDAITIVRYVTELHDWIAAAAACLNQRSLSTATGNQEPLTSGRQ